MALSQTFAAVSSPPPQPFIYLLISTLPGRLFLTKPRLSCSFVCPPAPGPMSGREPLSVPPPRLRRREAPLTPLGPRDWEVETRPSLPAPQLPVCLLPGPKELAGSRSPGRWKARRAGPPPGGVSGASRRCFRAVFTKSSAKCLIGSQTARTTAAMLKSVVYVAAE